MASNDSYGWSEGVDESLNFWFWLHAKGEIDDVAIVERIQRWADRPAVAQHLEASTHKRWSEFLSVWPTWKRRQSQHHAEEPTSSTAGDMRSFYKAMAATRVKLKVQWVMAPSGERWLVPPDIAIIGADGLTKAARNAAVLDAATELRGRRI